MSLDLPTMIWVMILSSLVISASVLFVNGNLRSSDGLAAWGWSMLLHGLSYAAFALRLHGWTDISIVLSNLFLSATLALQLLAIWQFQRAEVPALPSVFLWLPFALYVAAGVLFVQNHLLRQVLVSICGMVQAGLMVWQTGRIGLGQPHQKGRRLLWLGGVTLILVFLMRGVQVVRSDGWQAQVTVPHDVQSFAYLSGLLVMLLTNVGYLLMHMERAIERQSRLATVDALTGALNRRGFHEKFDALSALAERKGSPLGVMLLDIDRFKDVNDTYGHAEGDSVLKQLGGLLRESARPFDLICRWGGEEFLAVLMLDRPEEALAVAERLRTQARHTRVRQSGEPVTLSAGLVLMRGNEDIQAAVERADGLLYRAKHEGRDRIVSETPA